MRRAVAVCAMLLIFGCSGHEESVGPSGTVQSFSELFETELGDLAGVADVEVGKSPVHEGTAPDPLDADAWNIYVTVTMADDATDEEMVEAAQHTRGLVLDTAGSARWTAHLVYGSAGSPEDGTGTKLQIELVPTLVDSVDADVRSGLKLLTSGEVTSIATGSGFVSVTVRDATALSPVLQRVRESDLWAKGGTLVLDPGRVKIVDVPGAVDDQVMEAILTAAVRFDEADFTLEGRHGPELYANHLTRAQGEELVTAFTAAELAGHATVGYSPDFNLRVFTDSGSTMDIVGTFGNREVTRTPS